MKNSQILSHSMTKECIKIHYQTNEKATHRTGKNTANNLSNKRFIVRTKFNRVNFKMSYRLYSRTHELGNTPSNRQKGVQTSYTARKTFTCRMGWSKEATAEWTVCDKASFL